MSKIVVGVLFAALVLIALAVAFDVMFVAGGSGVVMVVALATIMVFPEIALWLPGYVYGN